MPGPYGTVVKESPLKIDGEEIRWLDLMYKGHPGTVTREPP